MKFAHALCSCSKGHPDEDQSMARLQPWEWLTRASERMHRNKLVVALANKLAFDMPRNAFEIGI